MADYSLGTAHGEIRITADTTGITQANQQLGQVNESAGSAGEALDRTANGMGIAGLAIAGGLGLATKTAADFEYSLSQIKAVSGATAGEMEKVRDKALQIGTDTAFSASEGAAAMEELLKAGLSVDEVLSGAADATIALAAAGEVDLPAAATIASNAMNQFQLGAEDMAGVADTMAGAANASAVGVLDVGEALGQVGPIAAGVGLSFEDTVAAISQLGNVGITGSAAGTQLAAVLRGLQNQSGPAQAALQELGLVTEDGANKFFTAEGKLKSMAEIQQLLQDSTSTLSDEQRNLAFQTIFGAEALSAATTFAHEGADGFNELNEVIQNTSAADVAADRMDNFKSTMDSLMGSVETMAIAIGTILIPVLSNIATVVSGAVNWFNGLGEGTQRIITVVLASIAGFLLFGATIIKTVRFVQSFISTLKALGILSTATRASWIKTGATMIATWIKTAASAVASAATTTAAWVASTAKTLASWALLGVQAVISGAKVAGAWILTHGAAALSAAASTAVAVGKMLVSWALLGLQSLLHAAKVALAWVIAMGPIGWAIALFAVIVAAVILFWDEIVAAFQAAASWVAGIMQSIWATIQAAWNAIVEAFRAAGAWIMNILTQMWNAIKAIWDAVLNFFRQIPGWIGNVFSSALNWLINAGRNILQGLWNGIKAVWNSVIGWIGGIGSWIIGKLGDAGSWLLDVGRNIIQGLWNGISNAFGWLWDKISGFFSQIWDGIKDFFGIGSPSKLFRDELGKQLMIGMSIGIDKNASEAINSALDAAAGVTSAVSMSVGGPDAFWDGTALGAGSVPASPEVVAYSAAQGDPAGTTDGRVINFNTYNPVAERASDSEARRLRALSALGAF